MIYFFLSLLLTLIDQGAKLFFSQRDAIIINTGGVFGLLPGFAWTGFLAIVFIWLLLHFRNTKSLSEKLAMSLILSGGGSNLFDRIIYQGVRDYIHYPIINLWGNFADIILVGGALILIFNHKKI